MNYNQLKNNQIHNSHIKQALIVLMIWVIMVASLLISGCGYMQPHNAVGVSQPTVEAPKTEQPEATQNAETKAVKGLLDIYTLDIGQGDAHLLLIDGKYTLIDTADVEHREFIVAKLKSMGVTELENVILTHTDSDHIGGFWAIAQNFKINHVYDNGYPAKSSVYKTYSKTLEDKQIPSTTLRKGDIVKLGEAEFIVYAPWEEPIMSKAGKMDANNNSIVGKLVFGKFSMLFTGDAAKLEEDRLIKEQNTQMFSRILKVGHHGSSGSSTKDFIRSIRPESAVISVGVNNDYGHPTSQTLDRLSEENVKVYRTDQMGVIHIQTDGKEWNISTER